MDLGNKLIKLRKKEKLSQESLAEKLGVTRQTISNWELNITKPDIFQIKNISAIFNVSIDDLLDNNIRDIIEKKISKNIRIIIITLYFIILVSIISFTIYLLSNNDFTKDYQGEFYCTLDKSKYYITIDMYGEDDVATDYVLIVTEQNENNHSYTEKMAAGNSFAEAMESLKLAKEVMLDKGATCK